MRLTSAFLNTSVLGYYPKDTLNSLYATDLARSHVVVVVAAAGNHRLCRIVKVSSEPFHRANHSSGLEHHSYLVQLE